MEETPASQLGSLAAQALINRNFTKKLKQSIAPKTRVGFAEFQSKQSVEEATPEQSDEPTAAGGDSPPPKDKKVLKSARTSDPLPSAGAVSAPSDMKTKSKSTSNLADSAVTQLRDESAIGIQRIERGRSTRKLLGENGKLPTTRSRA